MRILIADDEPAARRRLRALLEELGPDHRVVGEAADGVEVLERIPETHPDLVLIDIRMPRLDGLNAAQAISRLPQPPALIFTTAHDEYAVEAFEVAAIDYLLKPIRKERLATALERAARFGSSAWQRLDAALPVRGQAGRSHFCCHAHGEMRLIPVAAVVFLHADSKYTTVRTENDEALIEDSLVALEQEFGDRWLRIHRNALVARDRVVGLVKRPGGAIGVRLHGVTETPEVSRRHLSSVRALLRDRVGARGED